tara:strand:- start:1499 stop:3112 length:1614 start_codon:yes stop_codon:yes gene_type:complete
MATSRYKKSVYNKIKELRVEGKPTIVNLVPLMQEEYDLAEVKKTLSIEKLKQEIVDKHGFISTADNKDGSAEQFVGRKNYKTVYNDNRKSVIDTWYDMPFFGRTDIHGLISQIVFDPHIDLVDVGTTKMLSFVAEAFLRMAEEYNARADSKLCCRGLSENTMMPALKAVKSYVNPHELHDEYLTNLYSGFFTTILAQYRHSNKIKNIDDFYKLLKDYLRENKKLITTPGFMEGKNSTVFASGLVIDTLSADPDDDTKKIRFLEDPNFEILVNLARKYGFKVDINIPWRLIFDYRTPEFKEFLLRHSVVKPHEKGAKWSASKFAIRFHYNLAPLAGYSTFSSNYNGFVATLNNFYNQFIKEFPEYVTDFSPTLGPGLKGAFLEKETIMWKGPKASKLFRKIENANKYDTVGNLKIVSEKYLEWYAEIRNIERGAPFSSALIRAIKRESRKIYSFALKKVKTNNINDFIYHSNIAINYIEYILGSIGSFSKKSLTPLEGDATMVLDKAKLAGNILIAPQKFTAAELKLSDQDAAVSTGY